MPEKYHLSVVVPAYKEEERIHKILDAIIEYQKTVDFKIEVVVVVDGSPDKSADAALKYKDKIPALNVIDRKENKGKGYTVKEGVMAAKGEYIIFSDADKEDMGSSKTVPANAPDMVRNCLLEILLLFFLPP